LDTVKGRKLFVLGHARSGTTILGRLLNSAEEVLLLGEAHLFESHWNSNFVSDFNGHHQRTKKVRSKGTRLPPQYAGMLPEAILQRLGEHYRWVGEKIAISPMSGLGARAASQALDYYQAYHLDASYVLTFRAPLPSLQSLHKLFPGVALAALLQGWMLSFVEIGAASNILQRVSLLPLELLSIASWERLQQKLGIDGRADAAWIDAAAGRAPPAEVRAALTRKLAAEMGWQPQQAEALLERLGELYAQFVGYIVPDTLYYAHSVPFAQQIARHLLGEVQDLAASLAPPAALAPTLPASVCGWSSQGTLHNDKRVLPPPGERTQRFARILRDSLCNGAAALPVLEQGSGLALLADGVDLQRDGAWLRLRAQADAAGHKHLTVQLPIATLTLATVRFLLRREAEHSRFLMLQVGDAGGFYNSVVDCQQLRIQSIATHGQVKCLFARIEQLANGNLRVALSGMLTDGRDSYLRLYLCDDSGAIDLQRAPAQLSIGDLVLSYSPEDCALDDAI
jgi:hypothetical protein